jgi:hypothetical protein
MQPMSNNVMSFSSLNIFNFKLLVILDDTTFFCEICEDLKDLFVIGI